MTEVFIALAGLGWVHSILSPIQRLVAVRITSNTR